MKKLSPLKISIIGFAVALNIVGAFIALNLRLPIYMDSIGTIMIAFLMGPVYGVITGIIGSFISGITFDIYSIYFAPVQIFVGLLGGIMFKGGFMKGYKMPFGVLILSIFSSLIGAIIAAFLFNGVTSSGSSYIVTIISNLGLNKVISVFLVQFITDYIDRFISVALILPVVLSLPERFKHKIIRS
ncbi:ECF transporter S component [Clostridium hydrogeniformans]|uniref:ECF transporter S component n=1 Tax=Clostridium hydrogeniformans TaxID=349933 RepID=UPI0004875A00|nr:ECF transporter S component [Clostridium hydrogeniformans]